MNTTQKHVSGQETGHVNMCAAVSASQDGCTNTPRSREAISYCEGTTVHILHGERICPPLVLVAIMLVIASFQLNATMLSPAIGDMATRLGTNAGVIGWSSMLFLSVAAGLAIFFPPLADKIGRRTSLLISVAFMVIGTVLVIVSDSVWLLMVGRFLQGFCGATFALGNLTLRTILPAKKYGFYLGLVAAINSGVAGIDTLAGGLIVDFAGYKGIFCTILVIEILAIVGVILWVPETKVPAAQKMDWGGALSLTGCLWSANMMLTFGFGSWGWMSSYTLTALACSIIFGAVFVYFESHAAFPLLPLSELLNRHTWGLATTTLFTMASAFSVLIYLVPAVAQDIHAGLGMGGTVSALMYLMPFSLVGWFFAPFVGKLAPKWGYRVMLRLGLAGSIVLLFALVVMGFQNRWALFGIAVLMGLTFSALSNTTLNAMGVLYASASRPGVLPGITSAAFNLGAGIGTGIMSSMVASSVAVSGSALVGYHHAALVGCVCACVALVFAFVLPAKHTQAGEKI